MLKEALDMARVKKRVQPKTVSVSRSAKHVGWGYAPLKGSFMVLSILGFLISAYLVFPASMNYGVAFMSLFTLMFIASIISMTKAPLVE
ncbi:hypothetical protein HYV86_06235 [Candidatus Woesearchaeota archaeon]|nr:hypothetical protein [Candidatus Woesearchaeota archaeon]